MNRKQQAAWGRIGGLVRASRYAPDELTAAASAGFAERFRREVDPNGVLDPVERERRADLARKAYMRRLAIKSAQARSARNAAAAGVRLPTATKAAESSDDDSASRSAA